MNSSRAASNSTNSKSKATRSGLHFPVGRVSRCLKERRYSERIAAGAPVYLAAVLQRIAAEVLELSGKEAKSEGKSIIVPQHIELAIRSDKGRVKRISEKCYDSGFREEDPLS